MKNYGRTYWFTWGFLILAASFTGVASVKSAFFGGMIAALVSTAGTRPYERLGARYAPLLGALLGLLWAVGNLYFVRWTGDAEDVAFARWNLGTDIAIHAAGFAGGALLAALAAAQPLGRSIFAGALLASAMTAVPYGFIDWVDYRVAGPVEVVLFASADVPANEAPLRRPGAEAPVLSADEVKALKESLLVVEGPGGLEVLDDAGRRHWPLWRKRFTYPGNRGGPVRRVLVLMPSDAKGAPDQIFWGERAGNEREHGRWTFHLGANPKGITVALLKPNLDVVVYAEALTDALEISLELNPLPPERPGHVVFNHSVHCFPDSSRNRKPWYYGWAWDSRLKCEMGLRRHSPFGEFYVPDVPKSGPYFFDYYLEQGGAKVAKELSAASESPVRPDWTPPEAKQLLERAVELSRRVPPDGAGIGGKPLDELPKAPPAQK